MATFDVTIQTVVKWDSLTSANTLDFTGVTTTNRGRIGDRVEIIPTGGGAPWFNAQFVARFATAPVVDEVVRWGWIPWGKDDQVTPDGLSTTDAVVSAFDELKNAIWMRPLVIGGTSTANKYVAYGRIYLPFRYVSPVVWLPGADDMHATDDESFISLEPIQPEST